MLKFKSSLLLAALALSLLAASSLARAQATSSTNGTTYICVDLKDWQLRNVSGPHDCKHGEILIIWNLKLLKGEKGDKGDKGDKGAKGDPGQSVTSAVIPLGDARCPNGVGGVQYTDSTGVRVVCNGQQGEKGEKGDPGSGGGGAEIYYTQTRLPGFINLATAPTTTGFVDMSALTLPEGSYIVYAKVNLRYRPLGVTDSSFLICKLYDGTIDQEVRILQTSPPGPASSWDFSVSATLPMTFGAGGGTALWACSANPRDDAHEISLDRVQIWAIKASPLHIQ